MEQIDFDMMALAGELTEDECAELSRFIDLLLAQRDASHEAAR